MFVIKKYVILSKEIIELENFLAINNWMYLKNDNKDIPKNCVSVYNIIDNEKKIIVDKLYIVTWSSKYNHDFKDLNLSWVKESFEVEDSDIKQLENPNESIIKHGGQIFFLLRNNKVIGTIAMMINHGECELGKLTISKEFNGKGFAHLLMKEGIEWARKNKYKSIMLLCNTKLENVISLYKKYDFKTEYLGKHPDYKRCNIVMRLTL